MTSTLFETAPNASPSPNTLGPAVEATATTPAESAAPRTVNRRSRSGCLSCRGRRIKCDEARPVCKRCEERSTHCQWPPVKVTETRHRNPRALKSCEPCRQRKTKCGGPETPMNVCRSCLVHSLDCKWPEIQTSTRHTPTTALRDKSIGAPPMGHSAGAEASPWPLTGLGPTDTIVGQLSRSSPLLSIKEEEKDIINELARLYFSTAHYFGYLTFIHEAEYWDRYDHGDPPIRLTLLMAANALRFGGRHDACEKLGLADRWASQAGETLITQTMQEFGAIELMEVVLYQHYEFQCGRYSRGWVLAGMAVRMMTFLRLHMLDESFQLLHRPMLSAESLRRLAWAVYFLDATIDGGIHGFTAIPDGSFTIPLPCDEQAFLRHSTVSTEHMAPSSTSVSASIGLSGHLLRAMHVRQLLAGLHSRISRCLVPPSSIATSTEQAEADTLRMLGTLPDDMQYSRTNFHIHKSQQTLFLHVHFLRNTCFRHLALLKILCASTTTDRDYDVSNERQSLIRGARQLSALCSQAVDHSVVLDPQSAMHAYNGIEVLLYQPLRQTSSLADPGLSRDEISSLLKPLLRIVRETARVSELVALLYPEAVNRMIRMGFAEDIVDEDMLALLKKVHRLANADTEFDFHDSFWRYELALQRVRGDAELPVSPDNILLEVRPEVSPNDGQKSDRPPLQILFDAARPRLHSSVAQQAQVTPFVPSTSLPDDPSYDSSSEIDWQAAFSLPVMDLQALMTGQTTGTQQSSMPFSWASFNGASL